MTWFLQQTNRMGEGAAEVEVLQNINQKKWGERVGTLIPTVQLWKDLSEANEQEFLKVT